MRHVNSCYAAATKTCLTVSPLQPGPETDHPEALQVSVYPPPVAGATQLAWHDPEPTNASGKQFAPNQAEAPGCVAGSPPHV
jgi:hypothetical protein